MKAVMCGLGMLWILVSSMTRVAAAEENAIPAQTGRLTTPTACATLPSEQATKLGLIRQMLADGKPHAAIAHLDAANIKSEEAALLRANGLRQTGRLPQAQAIYQQLRTSCVSGYAYQGLGLLAQKEGHVQASLRDLETASRLLPTEHTIRNDYGYVLMQSGNYELALHEFLTAVELAPGYRQAANNLILLLYRHGENERAETVARQFGVSTEEMQTLRKMSQADHSAVMEKVR